MGLHYEVNATTREIIERELTEFEIEAEKANIKKWVESANIKDAASKASKAALLEKLGITEEEAKLLLS